MRSRFADLASSDAELVPWFSGGPFAEQVSRLCAYRGIDQLGALTLASEVCDFRRFASAQMFHRDQGFGGALQCTRIDGSLARFA